jgi:urease accessory protein
MSDFAAMVLADGRFPIGGHVHSAGVESAVADGRIHDVATLEAFVVGRLHTVGLTDAALSAATTLRLEAHGAARGAGLAAVLEEVDAEADARSTVPALRASSRKLGRQLVRVAGRCWPAVVLAQLTEVLPAGAHVSVALGAVGVAAGMDAPSVAALSLFHALTTPANAAVRLLGLDPFAVAALTVTLTEVADTVAGEAVAAAHGALADLPARTAPIIDIAANEHPRWDMRLFAT